MTAEPAPCLAALAALCRGAGLCLALLAPQASHPAGPPSAPWPADTRCVVPAKPGGGFDLTCQLLRAAWPSHEPAPALHFWPGGIGALAFAHTADAGKSDGRSVVAFSSGTLLNLAQGRFGRHQADEVHWLAALALDHGVVAVHRDAPWPTLTALAQALRQQPAQLVFGIGGTLGSQDWLKAALLAREAGVSPKAIRVVAFEGGGDALTALVGQHVQVFTGDAAEVGQRIAQGAPLRVLAVLAPQRLPGRWRHTPTATEQGLAVTWPIVRGLYMGRDVSPAEQSAWRQRLLHLQRSPVFARELARLGLHPLPADMPPLAQWVPQQLAQDRELLHQLGWAVR